MVLGFATRTFKVHPINKDSTDPILGHPNEFYKEEDDRTGWNKYLFGCKQVRKGQGKEEFDIMAHHAVISRRIRGYGKP